MTVAEIASIAPGTPQYNGLKGRIISGDAVAAKDFVYVCAWRNLRRDKSLTPRKRVALLTELMTLDLVKVNV